MVNHSIFLGSLLVLLLVALLLQYNASDPLKYGNGPNGAEVRATQLSASGASLVQVLFPLIFVCGACCWLTLSPVPPQNSADE